MRIAFRVDASYRIGTGHVMRCLTLANELRRRGDEVLFVSRAHPGHEFVAVENAGITVLKLDVAPAALGGGGNSGTTAAPYAAWLGVTPTADASDTASALEAMAPLDWLVVDHYGLAHEWETRLRALTTRIAVIDDLADRPHDADVLIDPTLGRAPSAYRTLLPAYAALLLGPEYAPLRPEFAALRSQALARRCTATSRRRLLVSLGGNDPNGATVTALTGLALADLPSDLIVEVVIGVNAFDPESARRAAACLDCTTEFAVGVPDLAARMVQADLTIGATGTTSWERCCLGLPAIVISIADNQRPIAAALEQAGAVQWLGDLELVAAQPHRVGRSVVALLDNPAGLDAMAQAASAITDGHGAHRVADMLHANASRHAPERA